MSVLRPLAALLLLAASSQAKTGIKTPMGEVVIKGLMIGQTYSLATLANLPLRLVNTGDYQLEVEVVPILPTESVLRKGYDPVPSLDWLRVERSMMVVGPGQEVATDVILTIPNDESLLGRKIQAGLWSRTRDPNAPVAVAVQSHLLLQISSERPTEEELKKKFVDEAMTNLDFTVSPTSVSLGLVAPGRKLALRKEKKVVLKLVNPNDAELNFRVKAIPVWESLITAPDGVEPAYDPKWLRPDKEVVKAGPSSIVEVPLTLEIPDEPRNRGKRFMLLLSVEVLEQKISSKVYSRYFVETSSPSAPSSPSGR